jgi:hypothetical protein
MLLENRKLQQSKAMAFFISLPFEFLDESNLWIWRRLDQVVESPREP